MASLAKHRSSGFSTSDGLIFTCDWVPHQLQTISELLRWAWGGDRTTKTSTPPVDRVGS